ncbi:pro-opiomelanocortin-like [Takifugu rubripes]|uniref:Pro-opiomelanocortin-like n=1 Tax=Takifugu rubripes TaxID=31033 RepID=H2UH85_TAKRU|nr:pro-opiomelanocortin-like [Takifugu rubripes]|eukprot:XP_003971776.1 PREDICTED: pro-opiomelanocortin-like [Takifugu rubripes]
MTYLRWLVVAMTYLCVPGFGSKCCNSSVCSELSDKRRILDYIQCRFLTHAEGPEFKGVNEDEHLLRILLAIMAPEDKGTHLAAHNDERRSYSMEHFRWGKPPGRKRRPVKVFSSSQEGGDSFEAAFPRQTRRQRSSNRDEQGQKRRRGSSRSPQLNQQGGRNGTYQMSHFRWGSPNVSERSKKSMKTRLTQMGKIFRNIIDKNVKGENNTQLRRRRSS